MMGGILSMEQVKQFQNIMDWEEYEEDENIPDEIKLTLLDTGYRKNDVIEGGDTGEVTNCDAYNLREVLFVLL